MFTGSSRPVVGLDIGSNSVKMVSLRANSSGYRVTAAAMSELGDGGSVTSAIRECLRSDKRTIGSNCNFVLGLSGPEVKVSSFNFTSLTLEEVEQAVRFEASQVCSFDIRRGVVDYQLISVDDEPAEKAIGKKKKVRSSISGFLAAATKETIAQRKKIATDASLKCVLIDSEALALLNCLQESLRSDELPAAVVNVGNSLTTVAILGVDGMPFVRELGYSGSDIIDEIVKHSGQSRPDVARQLNEGKGLAGIDHACKRLIRDVTETLRYYSANNSSGHVNHVHVCGGFSVLNDFVKALDNGIDSEVSLWSPFSNMDCEDDITGSDLIDKHGPAFAIAAGLAMRQV